MTNATFYTATNMFNEVGFFYGALQSYSSNHITIVAGAITSTYYGNFTYDAYGNVFGQLTGYDGLYNGAYTIHVHSMNIDAYSAMRAISSQNSSQVYSLAFSGNDTLNGSSFSDGLAGFNGNDELNGNYGDDTLDGGAGADRLNGGDGNDQIIEGTGNDTISGGAGIDTVRIGLSSSSVTVLNSGAVIELSSSLGTDRYTEVDYFQFTDRTVSAAQIASLNLDPPVTFNGTAANEDYSGGENDDSLNGGGGNDTLYGMDGRDTIQGGDGDDFIYGGSTEADLRDLIHGDDGNDFIQGGYGNDELHGGLGDDTIEGGIGSDWVIGNEGNDVLSGGAISDLIYGGLGSDFINGGYGYDRYNGGGGADRFFHVGVAGHGTDWIQDYNSAEGDVLLFGNMTANGSDFQLNYARTPGAGSAEIDEAFVIYRPTGQIMWALVDGALQDDVYVQINNNGTNIIYDIT